jgi:hypothetical protein
MLSLLIALIPLLAWWRFKATPIDRDFCPYAYPAVMGTPWLSAGHTDIKPPLIHWSYKCWLTITSLMPKWMGLNSALRMLPYLGMSLAVWSVAQFGLMQGLILALLFASPSLWPHMANTEWLTVALWALGLSTMSWGPWPWVFLGLTPLANQKNLLLVPFLAFAMGLGMPTENEVICLLMPSLAVAVYLSMTGRLRKSIEWCWTIPKQFGKARTFRVNTLSAQHLLRPGLLLMLPLLATAQWDSPWMLAFVAVVGVSVMSKQIVPHHYLAWVFPLAMASQPGPATLAAFAIVFVMREALPWIQPETIYKVSFPYRTGQNYGDILADGAEVTAWLDEHAKGVDTIWVNGWENQIYLTAQKKAWQINVPELTTAPEGLAPEIIVHCSNGCVEFDYDGYEHEMMTTNGFHVILRRK